MLYKGYFHLRREDRIRTCDPLVPNQVRYRPALLPELFLPGALLPQLRDYFPILSFLLQEIRIAATLPTFSRDAQSFCATSRTIFNCGGGGIRTRGTELPVRQFSKLLISATHPPHRLKPNVSGMAKLLKTKQSPKDLCN